VGARYIGDVVRRVGGRPADQQAATFIRRIAARVRDDGGQRFPVDPDVRQPQ
jgi:hypothetical protein